MLASSESWQSIERCTNRSETRYSVGIVMAVMNGFRAELLGRILGLNGHVNIYSAAGGPITGWDDVAARIAE
jgi:hypothetical protein